jgi:NAD-dependent dihydropyrimidine dehydrogenase PreA subunit
VKKLGDQIIFTDGHTRAFAAFLCGLSEVRVFWDEDELDWEAYEICVEWCKEEGIHTIADLKNRVVTQREYEKLWLKRCEKMQQDLEKRRRRK